MNNPPQLQGPVGLLNVVATPLGNLGDLTARARQVLLEVDRIYAEDTRRTRILLSHIGSTVPVKSLHEHNEHGRTREVLEALAEGLQLALVSDAGTPAISDPGADVVAAVVGEGFRVTPIPGVCAMTAALSVAGFRESSTQVYFVGFLATKGSMRKAQVQALLAHDGLGVFYESPKRLGRTLRELAQDAPSREAMVARELTKAYEELKRGSLEELAHWAESGPIRGEVTVVLGPLDAPKLPREPDDEKLDQAIAKVLDAGLSPRDAAAAIAALLEVKKRRVYNRINELMEQG